MILVMTTVGYGEIYPETVFGRLFTIITCIIGQFFVNLIIASLTGITSLSSEEEDAYNEITKTEQIDKENRRTSILLIQRWLKYSHAFKTQQKPFQRKIELLFFIEKIKHSRNLILNRNPQLDDAIKDLSLMTLGFIQTNANTMVPLKDDVMKSIIDIRCKQVTVDQKALEYYDVTMKMNSYICMTNRMAKIHIKRIDKLKMYFSSDGQKNKHIKTSDYLKEFMASRDPWIKFKEEMDIQKKNYLKEKQAKEKKAELRKQIEKELNKKKD